MGEMVRAVIVDDEELARELLREYLDTHESIEVVAECRNGFEAVRAVNELRPDLLFLDIQMPKLNGFEVLELLDHRPVVVFVTAYDEFALRAFEVHAAEYLLKPFSEERFAAVLDHVFDLLSSRESQPLEQISVAAKRTPLQRVLVREEGNIEVLPVGRIDYVEAQGDFICFATGERKLRKQQRLAELEEALDPGRFVRVHRSYLLNIDRIERIEPYSKDSRIAILKDGTRLPLSRSGYRRLRQLL
jgi:two-component system, LytTR family, response regulator